MGCGSSNGTVQIIEHEENYKDLTEQGVQINNQRPKAEIEKSETEQSQVAIVESIAAVASVPNHSLRTSEVEELSIPDKSTEEAQQDDEQNVDEIINLPSVKQLGRDSVIAVNSPVQEIGKDDLEERDLEEETNDHGDIGKEEGDKEDGVMDNDCHSDEDTKTLSEDGNNKLGDGASEDVHVQDVNSWNPYKDTKEVNEEQQESGETDKKSLEMGDREVAVEEDKSENLQSRETDPQRKYGDVSETDSPKKPNNIGESGSRDNNSTENEIRAHEESALIATVQEDQQELITIAAKSGNPGETEIDPTEAKDEENIVNNQMDLPSIPRNKRPATFAALYASCCSKWPIRSYARLEFPVNSAYGGCASLLFCSDSYNIKEPQKSTAEIVLVRSGFDCNHYGTSSIICGQWREFTLENYFQTDEEGIFHGYLMYGSNKVMLMSNDSQYGNLSNGVLFDCPPDVDGCYRLFADSNCDNGASCQLVLCSGADDSHAAYLIRTGHMDNYVQEKLIHGDNKWTFGMADSGEIEAEGPAGSRFCIYTNRPDKVIEDSCLKKPRILLTQAVDGRQPTLILDNISAGIIVVLCSSSFGTEDATVAAVYMITISSKLEISMKLLKSQAGQGCPSESDIWEFDVVAGKSVTVKGPACPCRYAMLSNMVDVGMVTVNQTVCLGTGESDAFQGEVVITDKMVKGLIDRPSTICIKVNHKVVASFRPEQLKQVKDGYAFCREWKQGEIITGMSLVRVYAVRRHVTSGKAMMLELQSSPKMVIRQKEGVVYAVNAGGPDYTSLDDVTYTSEHRQFVNYSYEFNAGSRHVTYGEAKTHTKVPSQLMNTLDGPLFAAMRTYVTSATDEQKVHYDVAVPSGTYVLRIHFVDRICPATKVICNGVNVTNYVRDASDLVRDFLPEHSGYTSYTADIPVNISNGQLAVRASQQSICGFSLLDMEKYHAKELSDEEIQAEVAEKQRLMDTIDPLVRSHQRKELEIVGWSQNLLKNTSGEEGNMSHWNTSGDWRTCEGGYGTEKAFQTSHMECWKYQSVNLLDHFSVEYLDSAPDILASEWYREGTCGGGYYIFEAMVLDENGDKMKSYNSGKIGRIYENKEWRQKTVTFTDYGPGARIVAVSSYGQDDKCWAGFYGTLISSAEIRVKRETQPIPDDSFTDINVKAEEAEFIANRDKMVVKMFSDNMDLMTELIEDKMLTVEPESITRTYVGKKRKPRKHRKREIRVFVSSTFKDFSEEREHLIKKTFREINQLCADRGVFFTYVDLRWGISEEQTQTGQTIAICLQEIDRCRPYFICMLGQRYGWSKPSEKTDESLMKSFNYAIENHPNLKWIEDYRDNTSVTQLEIMHGVLNDIEARKRCSFFYLRDPPDRSRMTETEFKIRSAESEWHADQQCQLRTRVATSQEINSRQFVSPEEVGILIKEDLEWCVNKDFPEGTELSPLEREQEAHQAFGDARRQVYIGRESYFEEIDKVMKEERDHPFVLLGESGSGKSALVANWVQRVREREKESFVFVHFIGSSAESASYLKLLRRLYEELKIFFDLDSSVPASDTNLVLDLARWLKMAAARGKCVIVFDALNQLNEGSGEDGGEHDLLWIPRTLPKNVFMLLSTLPGRAMESVKAAGWQAMKVELLDESQKREIIVGYLEGIYSKTLSDEQKQLMIDAPQTNNPLYLRSLLDEVRVYGSFRTLTQKIQEYLLAGNPGDLFAKILERLEGDFEHGVEQRKGLVRETTTAIWCSHRGMAEGELTDLLNVPSAVWSPFYLSLVENLVNRNGVVNFFHDHLRQAVEKKYLSTAEEKKEGFKHLANFFSSKNLDGRVVDELPFLLGKAEEFDHLKKTISDLQVFSRLAKTEDGTFELIKSWQILGDYSQAEAAYLESLGQVKEEDKHTEDYTQLLDRLGDFFVHLGLFRAARRVYEQLLEQLEDRYAVSHGTVVYTINTYSWNYLCKHPDVINALHQLGLVCEKQMELEAGVRYYQDAIRRQNRIVTPTQKLQLCEGLLGLATMYILQENTREAKKLLVRSLELATNVLGHKHHYVAAIHNKLGKLSYNQTMLDKAVGYFLQDLKVTRSDVGMTHPRIPGILSDLALVYDDRNDPMAGEIYETALAMLLDTYGPAHVEVAVVRYNLGTFYFATHYFAKAKYQLQEAYNVFLSFLGAEHPDTKAAKRAMDAVGHVAM